MSKWDERIRGHGIWQALGTFGVAIDTAHSRDDGTNQADIEALERARDVLAYIGKRLAAVDPALADTTPLDEMLGYFNAATNAMASFQASGDIAHLDTANKNLDLAVGAMARLPAPPTAEEFTTLSESAARYRAALEEHMGYYIEDASAANKKADETIDQLETLQQTLGKEKQRVDALVNDFQTQFLATQTARHEASEAAEQKRRDEHTAQLQARTTAFDEAEAKRKAANEALMDKYGEELGAQKETFKVQGETALSAYQGVIEEHKKGYAEAAKKLLGEIESNRDEVVSLTGIVGNTAISHGYQKAATEAHDEMKRWQNYTVFSLFLVVAVAILAFMGPVLDGSNIKWENLAARFILLLTVGLLAAYCRSQADKQYQVEKRNRRLGLELEALGPYLSTLSPESQQKFRYEMGERTFGRGDQDGAMSHDSSPANLVDLLAELQKRDPGFAEKLKDAIWSLVERATKKGEK